MDPRWMHRGMHLYKEGLPLMESGKINLTYNFIRYLKKFLYARPLSNFVNICSE